MRAAEHAAPGKSGFEAPALEGPVMDSAAFSPDGYIIDQRYTGAAKYGVRTSDQNGCGWISAYNFLRAAGGQDAWPRIAGDMGRSLFFCALGTSPFRLLRYLRRRGYALRQGWGREAAIRLAKDSPTGILFYRHSLGVHFVAFIKQADGRLRFFNAILGDARHVADMEAFLEQHARKAPIAVFAPR